MISVLHWSQKLDWNFLWTLSVNLEKSPFEGTNVATNYFSNISYQKVLMIWTTLCFSMKKVERFDDFWNCLLMMTNSYFSESQKNSMQFLWLVQYIIVKNFLRFCNPVKKIYYVCYRPVHVLLFWFYPDFILILSRFYLDFIQILSRFYPDFLKIHFIQILSRFYPNFWKKNQDKIWIKCFSNFIQILSRFYPDFFQKLG